MTIGSFAGYWANLTMVPQIFGVPFIDSVYWTLSVELGSYLMVAVIIAVGLLEHIETLLWFWLALTVLPSASSPLIV